MPTNHADADAKSEREDVSGPAIDRMTPADRAIWLDMIARVALNHALAEWAAEQDGQSASPSADDTDGAA